MSKREQSSNEEIANALSHGLGILLLVIAFPFLLHKVAFNSPSFYTLLIFGLGMLMVYFSSTMYHYVSNPEVKLKWQIADHICIYFLIAGTYTPLMYAYLKPHTALIFLSIMWSIVAVGIFFKLFFINKFEFVSVVLYLSMGWMLVFVIDELLVTVPKDVFLWIASGGFSYTLGVYFYVKSHRKYHHTIWHFFVLLGTICHFISVWKSV